MHFHPKIIFFRRVRVGSPLVNQIVEFRQSTKTTTNDRKSEWSLLKSWSDRVTHEAEQNKAGKRPGTEAAASS